MKIDNRIDSLKLMADWSKWLAAIDTAALAGLFSLLASDNGGTLTACTTVTIVTAMAGLSVSLWGACQFLFSMPRVVLELDDGDKTSLLDRKGSNFRFTLRRYQQVQYVPLYFCAIALAALVYQLVAARHAF